MEAALAVHEGLHPWEGRKLQKQTPAGMGRKSCVLQSIPRCDSLCFLNLSPCCAHSVFSSINSAANASYPCPSCMRVGACEG